MPLKERILEVVASLPNVVALFREIDEATLTPEEAVAIGLQG